MSVLLTAWLFGTSSQYGYAQPALEPNYALNWRVQVGAAQAVTIGGLCPFGRAETRRCLAEEQLKAGCHSWLTDQSSPLLCSLLRGAAISYLPSHIRGQRKPKAAGEAARYDSADRLWARVEAERRALEECSMQLRALLLAREHAQA